MIYQQKKEKKFQVVLTNCQQILITCEPLQLKKRIAKIDYTVPFEFMAMVNKKNNQLFQYDFTQQNENDEEYYLELIDIRIVYQNYLEQKDYLIKLQNENNSNKQTIQEQQKTYLDLLSQKEDLLNQNEKLQNQLNQKIQEIQILNLNLSTKGEDLQSLIKQNNEHIQNIIKEKDDYIKKQQKDYNQQMKELQEQIQLSLTTNDESLKKIEYLNKISFNQEEGRKYLQKQYQDAFQGIIQERDFIQNNYRQLEEKYLQQSNELELLKIEKEEQKKKISYLQTKFSNVKSSENSLIIQYDTLNKNFYIEKNQRSKMERKNKDLKLEIYFLNLESKILEQKIQDLRKKKQKLNLLD
ncbi:unnamed protein product [Paramecium sonneborni]|uniref:Uncharacterized protein n=1 Tax=Paramecium sonneborni TaxID=65129 RepID=A0A8S1MUP6_9CILI|nr:unnamed protein product [Paramecium sonneborni]